MWENLESFGPDQRGSVGWASSCKAKGHWFDSWSRAHAWVVGSIPVGVGVRGNCLMFLSLFLPPLLSL